MAEKKVGLPEWEECEAAVDKKCATALEEFIYEYEPGDSSSVQWRERLQRLVTTAPNTRQRAERAGGIYVASRASVPERGAMWRRLRQQGIPITSSWIDEDGEGATDSFSELWERITNEIARSSLLILYAEPDDFPLKGALIEAGIALGMNIPVVVCLPNVEVESRSCRPIGSWISHPLVSRHDSLADIIEFEKRYYTDRK